MLTPKVVMRMTPAASNSFTTNVSWKMKMSAKNAYTIPVYIIKPMKL